MATQTIRLKDEPTRFRFKMGEQVVLRGSDGYPGSDYSGVVVDGTWNGDPSGRSFEVTYQVKRDRDGSFDAREIHRLRRFEDEVTRREWIRELLRTNKLRHSLPRPPAGDLEGRETMRSAPAGAT